MIKVIDYGLGNVSSFTNAYKSLDIKCELAKSCSDLDNATHIILPGVGSFDYAMELFSNSGLREKIEEKVLEDMIPIQEFALVCKFLVMIVRKETKMA